MQLDSDGYLGVLVASWFLGVIQVTLKGLFGSKSRDLHQSDQFEQRHSFQIRSIRNGCMTRPWKQAFGSLPSSLGISSLQRSILLLSSQISSQLKFGYSIQFRRKTEIWWIHILDILLFIALMLTIYLDYDWVY